MPVERVDYSSDDEYQQALQMEAWAEQQHMDEHRAKEEEEEEFYNNIQEGGEPMKVTITRRMSIQISEDEFDVFTDVIHCDENETLGQLHKRLTKEFVDKKFDAEIHFLPEAEDIAKEEEEEAPF